MFTLMLLNGLTGCSDSIRHLVDNVQFLVQLAACDYFFLSQKPSTVAVAAIMVALSQDDLSGANSQTCLNAIKEAGLELNSIDTLACTERLKIIYEGNQRRIHDLDNGGGNQAKTIENTTPARRVTPTSDIIAKYSGSKRDRDEI